MQKAETTLSMLNGNVNKKKKEWYWNHALPWEVTPPNDNVAESINHTLIDLFHHKVRDGLMYMVP